MVQWDIVICGKRTLSQIDQNIFTSATGERKIIFLQKELKKYIPCGILLHGKNTHSMIYGKVPDVILGLP